MITAARALAAVATAALLLACGVEQPRAATGTSDTLAARETAPRGETPASASASPRPPVTSTPPPPASTPRLAASPAASPATSPTASSRDDTPPLLSASIVDLAGTFDPATSRLGALLCTSRFPTDPNDRWCFNAFGGGAVKAGVSLDYKVAAGATVRAATAGTVVEIEAETNPLYPGEFEIRTRSTPTSSYLVIYDHVRDPSVSVGATVIAGQTLGIVGIHTSGPSTWGRVELQVNHYPNSPDRRGGESLCPQTFGTEAFRREQEKALAAHNLANPAFASASVCAAPPPPARGQCPRRR